MCLSLWYLLRARYNICSKCVLSWSQPKNIVHVSTSRRHCSIFLRPESRFRSSNRLRYKCARAQNNKNTYIEIVTLENLSPVVVVFLFSRSFVRSFGCTFSDQCGCCLFYSKLFPVNCFLDIYLEGNSRCYVTSQRHA